MLILLFSTSLIVLVFRMYAEQNHVADEVFGGPDVFNAFKSARRVTAERLYLKDDARDKPWELRSYTQSTPINLSDDQIKHVVRMLSDASTYSWRVHGTNRTIRPCLPNYGVLFDFQSGPSSPKIALCFDCNTFAVFVESGDNTRRVNIEEEFDPAREKLVALIQAIFPSDPAIMALK